MSLKNRNKLKLMKNANKNKNPLDFNIIKIIYKLMNKAIRMRIKILKAVISKRYTR